MGWLPSTSIPAIPQPPAGVNTQLRPFVSDDAPLFPPTGEPPAPELLLTILKEPNIAEASEATKPSVLANSR